MLKNAQNLFVIGHNIYFRLFARRHIHGSADITDCSYRLLDNLDGLFFSGKVPLSFVNRPGGNHDGRFLILKVTEDFLCDKRHIRMKELQRVNQDGLKCPQSRRFCRVVVIPEPWFYHLDIPVAELLPDKIIHLLESDSQLISVHIFRHVFCQCIYFGQNPAIRHC